MSTSKNKHIITISLDKHDFEMMQRLYPECYKEFVKRSIKKAVQSRAFFDSVFFDSSILANEVTVL